MAKISRRDFIKSSVLATLAVSGIQASIQDSLFPTNLDSKVLSLTYFLKDSWCEGLDFSHIKAQKILPVDGDISGIYSELKHALQNKAIIGSISSELTFFVVSRMAADYGMSVIYDKKENGVRAWILAPKGIKIQGHTFSFIIAISASLVVAACTAGIAYLIEPLLDTLQGKTPRATPFFSFEELAQDDKMALAMMLMIIGVYFGKSVGTYIQTYFMNLIGQDIVRQLRRLQSHQIPLRRIL